MNELETKRLNFKLYKLENKAKFIDLVTDESVMKFVDTGVFTNEKAENLWKKLIENLYPQGVDTIYAVFAKDDERYIGHAAIRPRPTKKEDWEISYMLKTEEWGKGFATEIARGLIRFGFENLNLAEIYATVDNDNSPSIKVLEKAGMRFIRYEEDENGTFSVYGINSGAKRENE